MASWRNISTALIGILLLGACAATSTTGKPPTVSGSTDPKQILHEMATQLAQAPGFRVTIRSDYDAIQSDGQRIAYGEKRTVQLQRPNRLRVDTLRSDGAQGMLLFDGARLVSFKPQQQAYAQLDKAGSVDETVIYLVKDLQMSLPLARLLLTSLPQELDRLVTSIDYVEQDVLFETPTDHLAARSADVDVQLWITRGEQRVPRRIVITYKQLPGQPQFRAELADWDLSPHLSDNLFSWTPPAGTERVSLMQPGQAAAPTAPKGVTP